MNNGKAKKMRKEMRRLIKERIDKEKALLKERDLVKPLIEAFKQLKPKVKLFGLTLFATKDVKRFYLAVNTWLRKEGRIPTENAVKGTENAEKGISGTPEEGKE